MTEYPPTLREAGIGGTVVVWFFVSEEGQVLNRIVSQTSGPRPVGTRRPSRSRTSSGSLRH